MEDKNYDVVVIGAGHAGVEACLAAARLGKKTAVINLYEDKISRMPCNPSIGGPAKGIVVREIDALGGQMGKSADATAVQTKLLNSSKGPGVWALRVQSDKLEYSKFNEKIVKNQENLDLIVSAAEDLIVDKDNNITGVTLYDGTVIHAKAVVITTGTYLKSRILMGTDEHVGGPNDEITTSGISRALRDKGHLELRRFKTGTPARVWQDSVDLSKATLEPGTDAKLAFSFSTKKFTPVSEQDPCYVIHSTPETKKIVMEDLKKSAMYSGIKVGIGPRYCPSFEDKIVRFPLKDSHQIFIEPESRSLNTWYVGGFSSGMPVEVQDKMLRSLPGFENVRVKTYAYAIEYDCIDPTELKPSLELRNIHGLFTAGQINGTSGYEEAAGQGLIAGINAARYVDHKEPLILKRDQAYIGVMIDDLVTKGVWEPYRLLTSRAEHRLLLRNDNAEERLKAIGHDIGLVQEDEWKEWVHDKDLMNQAHQALTETRFTPKSELSIKLMNEDRASISKGVSGEELLKQPKVTMDDLKPYIPVLNELSDTLLQSVLIDTRFEGYVNNERKQAERFEKLERKQIPEDLDWNKVENIATEARQKLIKVKPVSVGQASRITGVNPADIQMLLYYLKNNYAEDSKENGKKAD